MRLSLVTRVFAGYFVVLLLLGSVATYAVIGMHRMQNEVAVVKQGLLPVSARLSRLSRDLNQAAALLNNDSCEEVLWLSRFLPDMKPFTRLEAVIRQLEDPELSRTLDGETRALFQDLSVATRAVVDGRNQFTAQRERLLQVGMTAPATDRDLYNVLVDRFLFVAFQSGQAANEPEARAIRESLEQATLLLSKQVREFDARCNLALNNTWSRTRQQEEGTVRIAVYAGAAALVVTLAILALLFVWLRPLRTLRTVAQRISTGDYDHAAPLKRGDEIGELSEELSKMAARLKEREEMIRKQADELVRADRFSTIGKMSTQIAHEIRNPLNALGLKLELLEDSVDEARDKLSPETHDELQRAVQLAGKEIDRLREITEYYLKFARFPKVEKENVDLHMVLSDVVTFYEEEAHLKGVAIDRTIDKPLRARADPNLLRHAMANLLKNAIEATAEGEDARIEVHAQADRERIRITVQDNGPGIPPEQVSRVFEPFYSTKRSGTGLGLTLVQQVVNEHGGSISCSSTAGKGTAFKLFIPA